MEQTLEEPVNGQAQGSFKGAAAPQVQHRMRLFTRQAFEQRWPAIRGAMRHSMARYTRRLLPDLDKLYSILETTT